LSAKNPYTVGNILDGKRIISSSTQSVIDPLNG
jgi:hypothetical protein